MRKPVRDYRRLRPSNLRSPEFRHLFWLLGWLGYFLMYLLTENLIPESACHLVTLPIDYRIPFCEWFVFAYVGWYVLIVWSLGYFLAYDVELFTGLQKYIIVTQVIAMICYIVYPSYQDLRPAEFLRENFAMWILNIIYTADTPTGVCPSLHVAYSVGIASTWLKDRGAAKGTKIFVVLFSVLVCASVSFVKQHAVIDIVLAIPVCLAAEALTYGRSYWKPKLQKHKVA